MTDEEREKIRKCAMEELERLKQYIATLSEEEGDMLLDLEIKWRQQSLDEMLLERRKREDHKREMEGGSRTTDDLRG